MHVGKFITEVKFITFLHKASLRMLKTKKGQGILGYNQSIPSSGARDNLLLVSRQIKY